jgi:hypothetical protein
MEEIYFEKGSNKVSLYANRVDEELKNKLITLTLATSTSTQSNGAKETKIVDLLRITKQYSIKAYITKVTDAVSSTNCTSGGSTTLTAKQIKDLLKTIASGSGEDGGVITFSYDGDTIEGYIESLTFSDESKDYPSSPSNQIAKYEVAITFVKGESAV